MVDTLPNVLTTREIADRERVDIVSVIRWCQSGALRAYRIGGVWRVPRDAYLEFRRHNTPAKKTQPAPRKRRPGPSRQRAADRVLDRAGM